MRLRTLGLAAALALALAHTSSAFVPVRSIVNGKSMPGRVLVTAGRDARVHRNVSWAAPSTVNLGALAGWHALWDHDTNVPLRMWGAGVTAPGTLADPAIAEATARRFLADHLNVLAPGAQVSDFTLVANQLGGSGDTRTVAFEQRMNGLRVFSGSIGFAFKADHLTMVSSTALPQVAATIPSARLSRVGIAANAATWLAGSGLAVRERAASAHDNLVAPDERVIFPIVHERQGGGLDIEYHVAESVEVEATQGLGRWQVFLDASNGAPVARLDRILTATSSIKFSTPDQSPTGTRSAKPAPFLKLRVNNTDQVSDGSGSVSFTGADPGTASIDVHPLTSPQDFQGQTHANTPTFDGSLVRVYELTDALVTDNLQLASTGPTTIDLSSTPALDAALNAYISVNRAKAFVRANLNPQLGWLDEQVPVVVNENSVCNAFSTGDDVHFFISGTEQGTSCENTGRMVDVVYHETGHSVHNNSVIPGQGAFGTDGASSLSEGLADTLGVSITGDSGLGRGFFFTNAPLRELDPVGVEKKWPDDADGEPHDEGEIIGETLWDLRKSLIAKLGPTEGFARLLKIYYGIMQRSPDIPSSYAEALVADDDDGDLTNGTPNHCEIDAAFGLHGLADVNASLGITPPTRNGFEIDFATPHPDGSCTGLATISTATVNWRARGGTDAALTLTAGTDKFAASIPTQPVGTTVEYQVVIALSNGTTLHYPDNPADPYYQFYVGDVTPIACTDFETGSGGWTHTGTHDEWEFGAPLGFGGDPTVAHGGSNVAGIDLGDLSVGQGKGVYRNSASQQLVSPVIDLQGHTAVHLQYYRWLTVEDASFDQATISSNGMEVWSNVAHANPNSQNPDELNHVDKEWVFEDVDLTPTIADGKVQVTFGLVSDQGLNLGGWNVDDVCVVAVTAPSVSCGNGTVEAGETCDDGNTADGDGCSATCQTEGTTTMNKDDGGCCSVGGSPAGSAALGLLTLGLVLRSRRKRS